MGRDGKVEVEMSREAAILYDNADVVMRMCKLSSIRFYLKDYIIEVKNGNRNE